MTVSLSAHLFSFRCELCESRHQVYFAHCHLQMPKLSSHLHLPQNYLQILTMEMWRNSGPVAPAGRKAVQVPRNGLPQAVTARPVGQLFPWVPHSLEMVLTSLQWRVCDLLGVKSPKRGVGSGAKQVLRTWHLSSRSGPRSSAC